MLDAPAIRIAACALLILHAWVGNAQDKPKPAYYFNAAWSPDGRRIVFESTRDGKSAIYTVGIDGTDLKKLTSGAADSGQARWSPDGTRLVFSSDRDGHGDLYLMNADGAQQVRLTKTPSGGHYQSSFSPDGRWVAFQGRADNAEVSDQIFVIRPDGTGFRQLTDSTTLSMGPRWSPDSHWITFIQQPIVKRLWKDMTRVDRAPMEAGEKIRAIRPDGSALKDLSGFEATGARASRTADGRTLYFTSTRDGAKAVYAMDADGSNVRRVVDAATVPDVEISPDGRYLVYAKKAGDAYGVFVYEVATSRERLVTGGAGVRP